MSELTERINKFEMRLRAVDGSKRTIADKSIIKLTRFIHELSWKMDKLEDGD